MERIRPGVGEIRIRAVAGRKPLPHFRLALGIGQRSIEGGEGGLDVAAELLAKQRQLRGLMRPLAQHNVDYFPVLSQNRRVVGLGEIVIVARHPENRHDRQTPLRLEPARQRDRGEGFVNRVQRAGK